MLGDVSPPIGGGFAGRLAQLHGFRRWTFPQGYDLPFLRLRREFKRFDEVILWLRRCIDDFGRVHVFAFRFMRERDCSLRLAPGDQNRSERNAFEPAGRADGRRSRKQCSDTKIRGAKLRGATRSAGSRRMNTAEINAASKNNHPMKNWSWQIHELRSAKNQWPQNGL